MKTQHISLFLSCVLVMAFNVFLPYLPLLANERPQVSIKCQTPHAEKSFLIQNGKVILLKQQEGNLRDQLEPKEGEEKRIREIASTRSPLAKTLSENGIKHEIHIEDTGRFDEASDYLTLSSSLGYKITYSLKCQKNRS